MTGKRETMSGDDRAFYAGFACAVACIAREHREESLAAYCMNDNGITVADLKRAGVEEFDLKPIRKAMR